jgi:hypothetical protein
VFYDNDVRRTACESLGIANGATANESVAAIGNDCFFFGRPYHHFDRVLTIVRIGNDSEIANRAYDRFDLDFDCSSVIACERTKQNEMRGAKCNHVAMCDMKK